MNHPANHNSWTSRVGHENHVDWLDWPQIHADTPAQLHQ